MSPVYKFHDYAITTDISFIMHYVMANSFIDLILDVFRLTREHTHSVFSL